MKRYNLIIIWILFLILILVLFIIPNNKLNEWKYYTKTINFNNQVNEWKYNESRHSCENEVIKIWNYEVASCNIWANWAWIEKENYWYLFQWGNLNPFKNDNSIIKSTLEKIDVSSCSPNNCKYDIFVKTPWGEWKNNDWFINANSPFWWNDCPNEKTPSYECKIKSQWPCPDWFHIPKQQEWIWVLEEINPEIFRWIDHSKSKLLLPFAWQIHFSSNIKYNTVSVSSIWFGYYWTSSEWWSLTVNDRNIESDYPSTANAHSIRCFKN